ncbi:MAG: response regulator [Plectolyngbya sp. WJT66-NPBG17]|jgi:CheY-like chemotaxis protein|nr:response regulator [Plectolyngbya sp. WJT66-NPBG17]MBW4527274.1 response regulator [Phormidium tanganyikae FI6-MK23]
MATVLIIDDAAFSRRMLRKYLQVDGYEILEAATGQEGLEMIKSHHLSCILTDLLMPDISGFELLDQLQQSGLKIPTIIISADIQDSSRQKGMELGAVGFINKPAKEEAVRQAVRQIFE